MKFYIGKNNGKRYEALLTKMEADYLNKRVVLSLFCYEIDSEGNKVESEVNKHYQRMLVADNNTGVDPMTGEYVDPVVMNPENPVEMVILGGKTYPAGTIGEYDFFNNVRENVPVIIKNLELATLNKSRNRLMPDGLIAEPEEE